MEEGKVHVGKSLSVVVEFAALSGLPYFYGKIIDYMVVYRGKDILGGTFLGACSGEVHLPLTNEGE